MSFEKQLIDTSVWINLFGKEKGAIPRVISEPIACCHLSLDKRLHVAISDLRGGGFSIECFGKVSHLITGWQTHLPGLTVKRRFPTTRAFADQVDGNLG